MTSRSSLGPIVFASVIVLCVGQAAVAQVAWTIHGSAVPPGDPGTWDAAGHEPGDVVFDDTTYHMFLVGGLADNPLDGQWSVGHWTSNDVDGTWTADLANNPVLEPGDPGQWDGYGIINIAVLYHEAVFHMWYSATSSYHSVANVGYATSPDGSVWTKVAGPLSGLAPGDTGAWDERGLTPYTVLVDDGVYSMWYTAEAVAPWGYWRIGNATSPDPLDWTKHPDPVLEGSEPWEAIRVFSPEVVPHGSGFAMWYSGVRISIPLAQVGYATSADGLDWEDSKWPDNPVLSPEPPCVDWLNSISVIVDDDTVHGWVANCLDIIYVTSPFDLVFFNGFESGDTSIWSGVVP